MFIWAYIPFSFGKNVSGEGPLFFAAADLVLGVGKPIKEEWDMAIIELLCCVV